MYSTTESPAAISLTPPSVPRPRPTGTTPESIQLSTWEWEGGQLDDATRPEPSP